MNKQQEVTLDTPVPFGKYKGQPMAALLADQSYIQWMMAQAWFEDRFPNIATYLRSGPVEQGDCTPEHNSLQMRFMDPAYCARLASAVWGVNREACHLAHRELHYEIDGTAHVAKFKSCKNEGNNYPKKWVAYGLISDTGGRFHSVNTQITEDEHKSLAKGQCGSKNPWKYAASVKNYEWRNWDLYVGVEQKCPDCGREDDNYYNEFHMAVELKPTIGEDYPAILRKVKQRRSEITARLKAEYYHPNDQRHPIVVVFTDSYNGKSATWAQVKEMFRLSNIALLQSSELPDGEAL